MWGFGPKPHPLAFSAFHSGVKSLSQHSLIKDQYGFTHKHEHTSSFSLYNFFFHYVYVIYMYILLIKTITKFSNVIGSQQPDLSINWTVTHVMLVTGEYAPFCARCCGALCWVTVGFFSIHNDVLKSFSAQSMLCSFLEFCHSFD